MARGILVTGGTGTVGRPLVARLQAEGHDLTFRGGAATVPDQLSGTQTGREHLEAQR